MTMSKESAYERLLSGAPMDIRDVLVALDHAGGFTITRSKKKQSHYKVRREGVPYPFILPVKHDGEVKTAWLRSMRRHFGLGDEEQEAQ